MKQATASKLRTAAVVATNIAVMIAIMFVWQPASAQDTIVDQLNASKSAYIYIYNKTDGSPNRLTIVGDDDRGMMKYFCSIKGILKVTLNGVEYTCDPEKWTK